MSRPPLPTLLLALVLLAAAPARADLATDILPGNDPDAAFVLLGSPEIQSDLKTRDPAAFPKVFARAAELKDLHDLFWGPDDAAQLRLALSARTECSFCQKSAQTQAWVAARLPTLTPARRTEIARVYWDWPAMNGARRAWLAAHGTDEAAWTTLALAERREKLEGWAKEEAAAVMAASPKNSIEADVMQNRVYGVYEVLGSAGAAPLMERLQQVRTGLTGLERAKAMVGGSKDPAVRRAYADALRRTDPAARLAALSKVFDGLGRRDPAVMAQAPARAGQTFDERSRPMVAALLASGLMRETDGTWAGRELRDFYAAHPLKVRLEPTDNPFLAWYSNDTMTFNEKFISQYVKSQGRTLADLGKDPKLLQPLLREIVPVFVHEATHHRQDDWAKGQGLPFYTGEGAEKEAMMVASLFVLQKARADPSYARFLADNQDRSANVKEALILAARLQKDRASWFGETVMATHYPEWLSIAGQVWCQTLWHNRIGEPIQAELTRRARLPEAERTALAEGRPLDGSYPSMEEFQRALPSVGTKSLEAMVAAQKQALEKSPDAYAAYVKRLEDVTALTDRRLDELTASRPERDAVPAPDLGRKKR